MRYKVISKNYNPEMYFAYVSGDMEFEGIMHCVYDSVEEKVVGYFKESHYAERFCTAMNAG